MIGSILCGRFLDKNYRRVAHKHNIPIDRKRATNIRAFPIERARLEVIWAPLIVGSCSVLVWGWILHAHTHLAVPLIVMYVMIFPFSSPLFLLCTELQHPFVWGFGAADKRLSSTMPNTCARTTTPIPSFHTPILGCSVSLQNRSGHSRETEKLTAPRSFIGGAMLSGAMSMLISLLIDLYPYRSATAMAGLNLCRCSMSAVGTAVIDYIIRAWGLGWTYVFVGCLMLSSVPALLCVMKFGPRWREARYVRMETKEREKEEKKRGFTNTRGKEGGTAEVRGKSDGEGVGAKLAEGEEDVVSRDCDESTSKENGRTSGVGNERTA